MKKSSGGIKLGVENKRNLAVLGGLMVVLLGVWWINRTPDAPAPAAAPKPSAAAPAPGIRTPVSAGQKPQTPTRARAGRFGRGQSVQEFKPSLLSDTPIDPAKVDPTLRLDLLGRLQNVRVESGARSIFDFGAAPTPKVQIAQVKPILPRDTWQPATLPQKPAPPGPPPPPPPPPPIPLKFYGFSSQRRDGLKRAFFLEGEDIFIAGEGDTIKSRYKVIRIGVNSAVVEDISNKHQQTLPLTEEAQQS